MMRTEASEATVSLTVNGDRREIPKGSTLAGLLRSLALDPRAIVVEHNRVIVRDRDRFGEIPLRDGDTLELVHFVGGG
jgi:thiamine biosynthesis protein ThiS